jgi:hypothetical protein
MAGQRGTNEAKAAARSAPKAAPAKKDTPLWKKQHIDFMNNIKYNRKIEAVKSAGGDINSVEAPKLQVDPYADYVQCPYCVRKFSKTAAERHINACATNVNKPKPPPKVVAPTSS